jgi:hypothetical protein
MVLDDGLFCKNGESHVYVFQPRLVAFPCIRQYHLHRRVSRDALSCQVVRRLWRCCLSLMGDCAIQVNLLRLVNVT